MKIYAYFKKKDGFTLFYSLLMIIIVLIFISVLVNIAANEYSQAEKNKNSTKAYFLARSGAEVMAGYINQYGDTAITEMNSYISNEDIMELKEDDEKISDIKIIDNLDDSYDIISTAEVKGEVKSIKALIAKTIPSLEGVAIFAKSNLDFSKLDELDLASGTVLTNGSTINDPEGFIKNDDQKVTNAGLDFPSIEWDDNWQTNGKIDSEIKTLIDPDSDGIEDEKAIVDDRISSSGYYKEIKYNNGNLEIDFSSVTDEINIAVDNFTLKSDMSFTDAENKFLNIYVKDSIVFQTPNVDLPNINFFLAEGSTMTLIANSNIPDDEGIFVYGPDSNFIMQSNQTTFGGAVVVDSFEGQGKLAMGNFIYEAFDEDELTYIENIIKLKAKYNIINWDRYSAE